MNFNTEASIYGVIYINLLNESDKINACKKIRDDETISKNDKRKSSLIRIYVECGLC